ncbi:hypothetical protein [Desulfovibrio sp.]|uniref:hypothetical protein n=1 Tax=Desulfovibrio sp. TaxID=885 RepID=UPI0025C0B80E|nr:hypothetical protein [Desulfovibrio sp.]
MTAKTGKPASCVTPKPRPAASSADAQLYKRNLPFTEPPRFKTQNFLYVAKTCRLHAIVYKKVQQPPNAAVPDNSLSILHFGIFFKKISFQKKKGIFTI